MYERVRELEPDNRAAAQQIRECRALMAALLEVERRKYRGMFEKLAKQRESEEGVVGEEKMVSVSGVSSGFCHG